MALYLIQMLHCPVCSTTLSECWKNDRRSGWACEVCTKLYKMDDLKNKILVAWKGPQVVNGWT